ncbi:MAG: type II secretion system GspH family protein [Victivallales bacterium]|nr:type II secretion system GspH family protein [Victivallales bacterium]
MKNCNKKYFTLTELLCSIVIMLILTVLLLTAVLKVRDRAKKTANINNLKQISYALQMYSMDHEGALPYISESIKDSRCLFLLMPYTNYTLKLFYPLVLYENKKESPAFLEYIKNPESIVDDTKNGFNKQVYPGYAYSAVDNSGRPIMDQRLEANQPVITNINGTYEDTVFILYHSGTVKKVYGPRANDSIITE